MSRKLIASAAWLYWRRRVFTRPIKTAYICLTIWFLIRFGYSISRESSIKRPNDIIACGVVLVMFWSVNVYTYLKTFRRFRRIFRDHLYEKVIATFNESDIGLSSKGVHSTLSWSNVNGLLSSSTLLLLFSSNKKGCIFLPRAETGPEIRMYIERKMATIKGPP